MRPGRYPEDHPLERKARYQLLKGSTRKQETALDELTGPLVAGQRVKTRAVIQQTSFQATARRTRW